MKGRSSSKGCGLWGRWYSLRRAAGLPWGRVLWGSGGFEHVVRGGVQVSPDLPGLLDPRGQLLHKVVDRPVLANHARDLRGRVDHRGVVAAAELLADLRQRGVGQLARAVHRDLARVDDVLRALVAAELLE